MNFLWMKRKKNPTGKNAQVLRWERTVEVGFGSRWDEFFFRDLIEFDSLEIEDKNRRKSTEIIL